MAIVERGDDGGLYVPANLLGQFQPHTAFEIQTDADSLVLRAIDRGRRSGNGQRRRNEYKQSANGPKRTVRPRPISLWI